jgi:hypothetical protein
MTRQDATLSTADLANAPSARVDTSPAAERQQQQPQPQGQNPPAALFPERDAVDLRKRWIDIQTAFVDEPRSAVQQADSLLADVMKRLADSFATERANLEKQWGRGDNVTTEDLRIALQRYRSFFDRLLSV